MAENTDNMKILAALHDLLINSVYVLLLNKRDFE